MTTSVLKLLEIMAALRDPQTGCPWDREQTFRTIAPYTVEEAYEVAEAAERDDTAALQEELGDLLLQVVFHARMAEEAGLFDFAAVAEGLADKLVKRHPHVFGGERIDDAAAQTRAWEDQKAAERDGGALDGVAASLPALTRAVKLQKRAARVGFDWKTLAPILAKIEEELAELRAEIDAQAPRAQLEDELGDVLFAVANLARHFDIDPEQALRGTNRKFTRRFAAIEAELAERGQRPEDVTLEDMDAIWERAKLTERGK
ncbi:MAG TPA: nucleoside triphosphate pyrophosphohydrolase [Gammaproteobacteria bacterium]|jgi:MazG family protein|nr:nucleoside triphosphate pyrophosphohydrolase [Gammaproteobacteria bacterium]